MLLFKVSHPNHPEYFAFVGAKSDNADEIRNALRAEDGGDIPIEHWNQMSKIGIITPITSIEQVNNDESYLGLYFTDEFDNDEFDEVVGTTVFGAIHGEA